MRKISILLVVSALVGCSSAGADEVGDGETAAESETSVGSETSSGTGTDEGIDTGTDTGTSTDTETGTDSSTDTDTGTVEPTWPKPCEDLYDPAIVPTFELTFSDAEWQGLQSDCDQGIQSYRPVEFGYAGETVSAMARLKGNWSWSCEKFQFVISFNEQDPNGRFHGLRKIMLDAPWYDRTLLHERMAFPLFESLGLPHSCVNNARLLINGSYYGFYANVERIDQEYLERNFEEPEGNLYQGGVELKTNETVNDTSRRDALFAATSVDEIAELMDLDEAVAEWAAEAMLPAMDNYWAGVEINYYLYDHPSRGFVYLPYDLDISFGDSAYSDGSLLWPEAVSSDPITYEHSGWLKEPLFQIVLADPIWCGRFVDALVEARAAYSPEAMAEQVALWADQIADDVAQDQRKPFTTTDHEAALAQLQDFFAERAAFVDAWLAQGDHCPAAW
ncbi:CotH kinase family protein [Nannocystaceae bacterium ST9]